MDINKRTRWNNSGLLGKKAQNLISDLGHLFDSEEYLGSRLTDTYFFKIAEDKGSLAEVDSF